METYLMLPMAKAINDWFLEANPTYWNTYGANAFYSHKKLFTILVKLTK